MTREVTVLDAGLVSIAASTKLAPENVYPSGHQVQRYAVKASNALAVPPPRLRCEMALSCRMLSKLTMADRGG